MFGQVPLEALELKSFAGFAALPPVLVACAALCVERRQRQQRPPLRFARQDYSLLHAASLLCITCTGRLELRIHLLDAAFWRSHFQGLLGGHACVL